MRAPSSFAPDAGLVMRAGLAGFAFTQLPEGSPRRGEFEQGFLAMSVLHLNVKAKLLPLLTAWRDQGIDALVFKGFYLAEFVYDHPAQRLYHDVDILLRPEQVPAAAAIAERLGWVEKWRAGRPGALGDKRRPDYQGHEVMHLQDREGSMQLDIHRRILHNDLPLTGTQQRFTEEAWRRAVEVSWEGTVIRQLDPLDSLLMGLVLNRCWSGDNWHLKIADFWDFRMLVDKYDLQENALMKRAVELGCRRTLRIFLGRCDAFRDRLVLMSPNPLQIWFWNLSVAFERFPPALEKALKLWSRAPSAVIDVLRELPAVLRILRLLRFAPTLQVAIGTLEGPADASTSELPPYWLWTHIKRGVRWSLKFLGIETEGGCPARTLTLYYRLRQLGYPATIQTEVVDPGMVPELRLELYGRVLDE